MNELACITPHTEYLELRIPAGEIRSLDEMRKYSEYVGAVLEKCTEYNLTTVLREELFTMEKVITIRRKR